MHIYKSYTSCLLSLFCANWGVQANKLTEWVFPKSLCINPQNIYKNKTGNVRNRIIVPLCFNFLDLSFYRCGLPHIVRWKFVFHVLTCVLSFISHCMFHVFQSTNIHLFSLPGKHTFLIPSRSLNSYLAASWLQCSSCLLGVEQDVSALGGGEVTSQVCSWEHSQRLTASGTTKQKCKIDFVDYIIQYHFNPCGIMTLFDWLGIWQNNVGWILHGTVRQCFVYTVQIFPFF